MFAANEVVFPIKNKIAVVYYTSSSALSRIALYSVFAMLPFLPALPLPTESVLAGPDRLF